MGHSAKRPPNKSGQTEHACCSQVLKRAFKLVEGIELMTEKKEKSCTARLDRRLVMTKVALAMLVIHS